MGFEFLLKALGVSDDDMKKLRELLNPETIAKTMDDFKARFEAMERQVMETHEMVRAHHDNPLRREMDLFTMALVDGEIIEENPDLKGLTNGNGNHANGNGNDGHAGTDAIAGGGNRQN